MISTIGCKGVGFRVNTAEIAQTSLALFGIHIMISDTNYYYLEFYINQLLVWYVNGSSWNKIATFKPII